MSDALHALTYWILMPEGPSQMKKLRYRGAKHPTARQRQGPSCSGRIAGPQPGRSDSALRGPMTRDSVEAEHCRPGCPRPNSWDL